MTANTEGAEAPYFDPEFYDDDPRGDDEEDGDFTEADCGRWVNGRLSRQCRLAGSEACDWDCPIGWRGDR